MKREKGFLKDKYKVNIGLTKDLLAEIDSNIENEVSNNINNYITPEIQKYLYGDVISFNWKCNKHHQKLCGTNTI